MFDAIDTVKICLDVFVPMISEMKAVEKNMKKAAQEGFINATDLADYLAKKGMPFRTAYKTVGGIVAYCVENGKTLDTLSLDEYKTFSDKFDDDLYNAIDLFNCVEKRISKGSTGFASVKRQIENVKEFLK